MAADAPEGVEIEEELERPRSEPPSCSPTTRAVAAGLALLVALGGFALATSAFLGKPPLERKDPPVAVYGNGGIAIAQGPDQDIVLIDPGGGASMPLVDRHGVPVPYGLEMAWSPDGSMLAYTDVRDNGLDGLFVLDLATGDVLDLSEGFADASHPAWSPDGTRIAFTGADRVTGYDIYVVGADGNGRTPITAEADNGVDAALDPAWSPDGSRIAFNVDRYDKTTETESHGIVVIDASGGNEIRLTDALDEQPVWSPDGGRLAFLRKEADVAAVYVVNEDGSGERRISGEWISTSPWSPDGTRLLFGTQDLETSNLGIAVVDVDSGDARTLLEDAYVARPVWSPDGSRIAFLRDDAGRSLPRVSLWVMQSDGSGQVELAIGLDGISDVAWEPVPSEGSDPSPRPDTPTATNGSIYYRVGGEDGPGSIESIQPDGSGRRVVFEGDPLNVAQVAWSSDGMRIAYRNPVAAEQGIYVANPDGTEPVRLTDGANDGWPTWSPDGSRIAFSSTRHDPSVGTCTSSGNPHIGCPTDIYVMDADGSNVTRLTADALAEYDPQWSPDGGRIAFVRTRGGTAPAVFTMRSDGTDVRQVSSGGGGSDSSPSWSPDGSQLVFWGFRFEDTGIWLVDADGSNEHQILGEDWYSVWDPVWSPDGTLIAFVGSPDAGEAALDKELYVMRPDGTSVTELVGVPGSGVTGEIAWQPLITTSESPAPSESPPTADAPFQPRLAATIQVGAFPRAVAVGEGAVWATVDNANGGPDDHLVVKIDPATNEIVGSVRLPEAGDLAVGEGAVWVLSRLGADAVVLRIAPSTDEVEATIPVGLNPSNVVVAEGAVWVTVTTTTPTLSPSGEVVRIDPATNEVVARIPVSDGWPRDVVVGEGSVWVYGHSGYSPEHGWEASSLWQIDPVTNELSATVLDQTGFLGDGSYLPDNVAVGGGWVWAASDQGNGVLIDAATGAFSTFQLSEGGFAWPFAAYEGNIFFGLEPVRILDMDTLEVVGSIALDSQVADAVLDPATGTLWIANYEKSVTRIDLH